MALKYSRVGKVTIGDNVFIGADSIILPAITIGNNVVVGNPGRIIISYDEFMNRNMQLLRGGGGV